MEKFFQRFLIAVPYKWDITYCVSSGRLPLNDCSTRCWVDVIASEVHDYQQHRNHGRIPKLLINAKHFIRTYLIDCLQRLETEIAERKASRLWKRGFGINVIRTLLRAQFYPISNGIIFKVSCARAKQDHHSYRANNADHAPTHHSRRQYLSRESGIAECGDRELPDGQQKRLSIGLGFF